MVGIYERWWSVHSIEPGNLEGVSSSSRRQTGMWIRTSIVLVGPKVPSSWNNGYERGVRVLDRRSLPFSVSGLEETEDTPSVLEDRQD